MLISCFFFEFDIIHRLGTFVSMSVSCICSVITVSWNSCLKLRLLYLFEYFQSVAALVDAAGPDCLVYCRSERAHFISSKVYVDCNLP
ncbi:hypothetical protein A4A49_22463 [Nicotiana attenuata]|uniref:Uncharacterized protein n=1 Tax=Nicotiana attenuata TaxID=49451 RepID=A0A1J6KAV8_NICAT|nr:hypothetical protein A4A49_22463 [Nicotiana attenuata]